MSCSAIGPNRDAVDHPWWKENFWNEGGKKVYGRDDWSVSEPVKMMVANWQVSVLILISLGGGKQRVSL